MSGIEFDCIIPGKIARWRHLFPGLGSCPLPCQSAIVLEELCVEDCFDAHPVVRQIDNCSPMDLLASHVLPTQSGAAEFQ